MSTELFDRRVELQLIRPQLTGFFSFLPNAVVVKDLRVQFSVEKSLSKRPNKCAITVTNMSEESRAETQTRPMHIRLAAGYADSGVEQLFQGDVYHSHSMRKGPDWETMIQFGDGSRAFQFARANRTFRSGVTTKTVVSYLASTFGQSIPTTRADVANLIKQYSAGITLSGPTHKQLSRVLGREGYSWSVQDGQLQIVEASNGTKPGEALLISQSTGMIGSPAYGAPTAKKKAPILTVESLLYPRVTPGGKIKVKSLDINGTFRVHKVRHVGDTHGRDWHTRIEATAL